jgi:hypothetical protein
MQNDWPDQDSVPSGCRDYNKGYANRLAPRLIPLLETHNAAALGKNPKDSVIVNQFFSTGLLAGGRLLNSNMKTRL